MAGHSAKFMKTVEKRGVDGTRVRSAEGSSVGLTQFAAEDARQLAFESANRATQSARATSVHDTVPHVRHTPAASPITSDE
jgi:hypothetical protein